MHPLKRISLFFCLSLLIYAVLVVPWPGLMDGYRACFRAGGNLLFHRFGSSGSVTFVPLPSPTPLLDTTMVLVNKRDTVLVDGRLVSSACRRKSTASTWATVRQSFS